MFEQIKSILLVPWNILTTSMTWIDANIPLWVAIIFIYIPCVVIILYSVSRILIYTTGDFPGEFPSVNIDKKSNIKLKQQVNTYGRKVYDQLNNHTISSIELNSIGRFETLKESGGLDLANQIIQDPNKRKNKEKTMYPSYSKGQETAKINDTVLPVLQNKFTQIGLLKALNILNKLTSVNTKINSIINTCKELDNNLIDVNRISELTNSLYYEGINLLTNLSEIYEQSNISEYNDLISTKESLEKEIKTLGKDRGTYATILQERLNKNTNNPKLIKIHTEKVDEVLAQVSLCIDALTELCLQLPELVNHQPKDKFDKTLVEINSRLEFAQKVKDEFIKERI